MYSYRYYYYFYLHEHTEQNEQLDTSVYCVADVLLLTVCREAVVNSLVKDGALISSAMVDSTTLRASTVEPSDFSPLASPDIPIGGASHSVSRSLAVPTQHEIMPEAVSSTSALRMTDSLPHIVTTNVDMMGSYHSLAKASPATSLIAETFTTTEEVHPLAHRACTTHACIRT